MKSLNRDLEFLADKLLIKYSFKKLLDHDITLLNDFHIDVENVLLDSNNQCLRFSVSNWGSQYFHQQLESLLRSLNIDNKNRSNSKKFEFWLANFENSKIANKFKTKDIESIDSVDDLKESLEDSIFRYSSDKNLSNDRQLSPRQLEDTLSILKGSRAEFSIPGAGKTRVILATHAIYRKEIEDLGLLIIGPLSIFSSWPDEMELIYGKNNFVEFKGGRRAIENKIKDKPRFILISYGQLKTPGISDLLAEYCSKNRFQIVVDESHNFKNYLSKNFQSLEKISYFSYLRIIMSGTPMPQSEKDMISQAKFLFPCRIQSTVSPELVLKEFKNGNYFVRRTQKDLGLKKISRNKKSIELSVQEKELQEKICSFAREEIKEIKSAFQRRETEEAYKRLKRCTAYMLWSTSNPLLLYNSQPVKEKNLRHLLEPFVGVPGISSKIEFLRKSVIEDVVQNDKKVLIWSNFPGTIDTVSELFMGIDTKVIKGGTSNILKNKIVEEFNDKSSQLKILIGNPSSCGEGYNMQKACFTSYYIERTFNAALYLQSEKRIHRMGQENEVDANIIVADGTIDDRIHQRLEEKVSNMARFLDDSDLTVSYDVTAETSDDANEESEEWSDNFSGNTDDFSGFAQKIQDNQNEIENEINEMGEILEY